jgi:hypothetical protein
VTGISFSPAEFISKLRDNQFASDAFALTGVVTVSNDDDSALLFAFGTECANWVKIPIQMIDTVQFLRVVPCKDHNHPLVTLIFRSPQSVEAQAVIALAKAAISSSNPQQRKESQALSDPISGHSLQQHALLAERHALMAQHHSLMATLDAANTVPPDANGRCPMATSECILV